MGKTKIKTVDDTKPEVDDKPAKKRPGQDELVERLKAELGIKEDTSKKTLKEESKIIKKEEGKKGKKTQPKTGRTKPRSKKYLASVQFVDPNTRYPLNAALDLVKKTSYSKFDGTLEAHLNINVKNLRGRIMLPFYSGEKLRILVFGKGAEGSGADLIGDEKILEEIKNGKIDFDLLITTPEWMPKIAPLAKILGPRGLMPNPKNGSIVEDLKKAVNEAQSGKTDYTSEPSGRVIHLSLGKISQPSEQLAQNIKVLIQNIGKTKLTKVVLSPTMGPGVKLDLSSI